MDFRNTQQQLHTHLKVFITKDAGLICKMKADTTLAHTYQQLLHVRNYKYTHANNINDSGDSIPQPP